MNKQNQKIQKYAAKVWEAACAVVDEKNGTAQDSVIGEHFFVEDSMSPDHPHGKPDPRWITDDGRCLLCADSHQKSELTRRQIAIQELEKTLAHIQDQCDEMAFVLKETRQYKIETPLEWVTRRDVALAKYAKTRENSKASNG